MCVPKPATNAAPASNIPTIQSADNLQLGGSQEPRGAAGLGRLQLRLTGSSPAAGTGVAPAVAAQQAVAQAAPAATATAGGSTVASPGGGAAGTFAKAPNQSLRLGGATP